MKTSPLLVWILLAGVTLAGVAAVMWIDPTEAEVKRRKHVVSSRLEGIHLQPGETGILFFGNSLLRQALTEEETLSHDLTEELQGNDQNRIRVINLTFGGANPQYLQTVADQIIALHPAVIVMQIDMIVRRSLDPEAFATREVTDKQSLSWRLQYWSSVLKQSLWKYLPPVSEPSVKRRQLLNPMGSTAPMGFSLSKREENTEAKRQEVYLRTAKNMWEGQTLSTTEPDYKICRQFIRRAVGEGIRVIFVQTPVGTTVESLVPDGYFEKRTAFVRGIIKPKLRPPLQYPRIFPDNCFRDYSHVNKKGQRLFLQWFIPALAREIARQE